MSAAEAAFEAALAARLGADGGVKAVLGDPVRIAAPADARPAFPYAEIVRLRSEPADASGVEAVRVTADLAIEAGAGGRDEAKAALGAVRDALGEGVSPSGWRVLLVAPVFADVFQARPPDAFRALMRIAAVMERE